MKDSVNTQSVRVWECVDCGAQAWGYQRKELVDDGWEVKRVNQRNIPLCPDCVAKYSIRRGAEKLLKEKRR